MNLRGFFDDTNEGGFDLNSYNRRKGHIALIASLVLALGVGGTLYVIRTNGGQAGAENRPVSRQLQSTKNPDFASLLKRLDKDRNGVTTVEEIVEGFGEIADKKGVYHHEYIFTLPDGFRQSLLIDLDYRGR